MGVEISHNDGVMVFLMVEEMGDLGGVSGRTGSGGGNVDVIESVSG